MTLGYLQRQCKGLLIAIGEMRIMRFLAGLMGISGRLCVWSTRRYASVTSLMLILKITMSMSSHHRFSPANPKMRYAW